MLESNNILQVEEGLNDSPQPVFKNIQDIVGKILKKVFSNEYEKQIIVEKDESFNFACPYCLDSKERVNLKRGHFYYDSLKYHCYNCGVHKSFNQFLSDYNHLVKMNINDLIDLKIETNPFKSKTKKLKNDWNKWLFTQEEIEERYNFTKIKNSPLEGYLKKRKQFDFKFFSYNPKYGSLIIYNLTEDNKILGFVERTFKSNLNKYYSHKLSKIYKFLNLEVNNDIMEIDNFSLFFNFFNIDRNNIITIFEGPLDCFLYPNSVAVSGVLKSIPYNIENKRFWLDNDTAGIKKSVELIEKNEKVFLWDKFFNDYKIKDKEIKDLNELITYIINNQIKIEKGIHIFDEYFSEDKNDLMYL